MRWSLMPTSCPDPRVLAALLLLLPSVLSAQAPQDTVRRDSTVFRVGEIIVQAARPLTTTGGASAIEIRLDSLVLPAAPSLAEVLRAVPLLHVRTNTRGEAEIAVRGSGSRQVAVLLDGVPLTLGWDGRADLSVVPATAPRSLTLVRGLSSVLHGPNALGGVVEVGLGRGSGVRASRSLEARASVDHVGGTASALTATVPVARPAGTLLLRGGLGIRVVPGSPRPGDVTEPHAGDDLRLNTDARAFDGFVALRHDWQGGAWLSAAASGSRVERGIAPELDVAAPRLWRYPRVARAIAVFSGGTGERASPLGGRGDLEASVGLDAGRTEIDQYASHAYDDVVAEEDGRDRNWTVRLLADQTLGGRSELRSAFTLAAIEHEERLRPGGDARYRQRLWSAGSEVLFRAGHAGPLENVRLSAGAVLDGAATPESGDKPALGALRDWGARAGATAAFAGGRALAHAGISRRVRFPSLRELYSGALGRFEPNPVLAPERLTALEAGLTARAGEGELQLVGFHHRLQDAIVRVATPAGRFQRVNRDQLRSTGLEVLAGSRLGPLTVAADLTWQHLSLRDPVTGSSTRPEHQPQLFGSARLRGPLAAGVDGGLGAHHTGVQYCTHAETGVQQQLAAGTRFNGDVRREWRLRPPGSVLGRLETRLAIENVLDSAQYEQCGLPQPGRLARLHLRLF